MVNLTAEAIMFAIQTAIKLGNVLQTAYANSLRSRAIVLPLPKFSDVPNALSLKKFFDDEGPNGGKQFLEKNEQLRELNKKVKAGGLFPHEKKLYEKYWQTLNYAIENKKAEFGYGPEEMTNLFRVRQWQKGKAEELSPLQLISGAVIEIGIDYFSQAPNKFTSKTAFGQSLKSFLSGFDDLELSASDKSGFKTLAEQFVPRLFISAAQVMDTLSDDVTSDPKVQQFIQKTSTGFAKSLYKRMKDPDPTKDREEMINWGQVVLKSMVQNAATVAFSAPDELLGTNAPTSKLIESTGLAILSSYYG